MRQVSNSHQIPNEATIFLLVSGGKAVVCTRILQQHRHKCLIVIGDGATDIEAAPPAHAAIGFGGNVVRQTVRLLTDLS